MSQLAVFFAPRCEAGAGLGVTGEVVGAGEVVTGGVVGEADELDDPPPDVASTPAPGDDGAADEEPLVVLVVAVPADVEFVVLVFVTCATAASNGSRV